MKRLAIFVSMLLIASVTFAQKKNIKRYAHKSGKIVYKWSGKIQGEDVLTWDDWGAKERRTSKTVTKMFGIKNETNTVTIMLNNKVYSWNVGEKKGSITDNPITMDMAEDVGDYQKFGEEMLKAMKYKKTGTETVEGKSCQLWEGPMGKIWIYKGYSIKTYSNIMGVKSTQTASSFSPGSSVNSSDFKIPSDIKFTTMEENLEPNENDDEDSKKQKEMLQNLFEGF